MAPYSPAAGALLVGLLLFAAPLLAAVSSGPPAPEQVRRDMGIPSEGSDLRGQRDAVGFASTAAQMARVWEMAAAPPRPETFGPLPDGRVAALIAPHDDYLYAGRVCREATPLVQARTVVLIGVFHRYRAFGLSGRIVFDPYRAWRTPDGPVSVSALRERIAGALPADEWVRDAAMHDSEHSVEALVYWLRHRRPGLEIVPVLVPAATFGRLGQIAREFGRGLAEVMRERGWRLGTDVALVISTDGVHYGNDFKHVPFGEGGKEAYARAVARDRALLTGPLAGPLSREKVRALYETFVDPADPDSYRVTWCGRFSIPFGLLALMETAAALGEPPPDGRAVAYGTSLEPPPLAVEAIGLGPTAPATLMHFVGHPAAVFTLPPGPPPRSAR